MTAYIDNIIIQGTPEEIKEFIELRKGENFTFGDSNNYGISSNICLSCYSIPCKCGRDVRSVLLDNNTKAL